MTSPAADSIGLSTAESTSAPADPTHRTGAPNVVVIVLDDTGFAQLGCYGSDIATPNLDRLAERGLRFTNFHTTAVCSPTRACLLTGRNHHRVGMGFLPDLPMNFEGYRGRIPDEAGTMAQVLHDKGWATFAVGKWHLTPRDERSPVGPFATWPLGKGFERYYGFLAGDANHWAPELVRDNTYVDPPAAPEDGYHLTEDLADEAITRVRELRRNQPDRPFLCWLALGATHAPHHVRPEWVEPYRGRFDAGWDVWREEVLERQKQLGVVPPDTVLSERPDHVAAWDSLAEDERRLYARMMEVYAAFLTHTDAEIGRVLDALAAQGELDDTIVVVVSDNGASGEGGPHGSVSEYRFMQGLDEDLDLNLAMIDELGGYKTYNHYPWGWAEAGNTPLRRFKRYTFEGGVRDPMIISWPSGIDDHGGVRHQYCHAVDVLPTLLDCLDVDMPVTLGGVDQMSLDGVSARPVFSDPDADDPRTRQYYECWGSRAMYDDGWKVVTNHVNQLTHAERDHIEGSADFHADHWALYDTRTDFGENHDLSAAHPERRDALVERWHEDAERNGVLPLSDGVLDRFPHLFVPWLAGTARVELRPGERVFEDNAPVLANGFEMTAHLAAPLGADGRGVIAEQGDYNNGWVWRAADGELIWTLSFVGESVHTATVALPEGAQSISVAGGIVDGGVDLSFSADGESIGEGRLGRPLPSLWSPNSSASLLAGAGRPLPVADGYDPREAFTGALTTLVLATDGTDTFSELDQLDIAVRHQ